MVSGRIYLHNYRDAYYPGSEIRGRFVCSLRENTSVLDIKVVLLCQEYTGTTEPDGFVRVGDLRLIRFVPVKEGQDVFCVPKILYLPTTDRSVLCVGEHEYPFRFTLPEDAPSSYSSRRACVTHKIKATIAEQVRDEDRIQRLKFDAEFVFWVISPIDFSSMSPELREQRVYSVEEQSGLFPCQSGSISLDVKIPKTMFVPGENIPITVHVANMSNSNVNNLKVKLVRVLYLKLSGEDKPDEFTKDVAGLVEHGVGAHGEHTYELVLTIPAGLFVYNFTRCKLIRAAYNLRVYCDMPFYVPDVEVCVPRIKIGHVPFSRPNDDSANIQVEETSGAPDGAPPSYGFADCATAPPLETPPPTYNEAWNILFPEMSSQNDCSSRYNDGN